jgi:glycosyltransferase involved in cell wall biosynthesis
MKILVVCHEFNNFGGIINHTEQLIAGFKDLGHSVDFLPIRSSKNYNKIREKDLTGYDIGQGTGIPVHQGNGWHTSYGPFLSESFVNEFVESSNKSDLIIWQSIFGFKNKETEGYRAWVDMIQRVTSKQIVIVHDGNLRKFYPWIEHLKDNITGLACVHPSAYESAEQISIPRALILNPQKSIEKKDIPFSNRKSQILSLQTFKRWKRVDDLIFAVPYLKDIKIIVAGDGMERAYMCSVDKCKPEYYCTPDTDPNADPKMYGNKIWDNALANGMDYLGFISETRRDEILSESKFLIDTSWSKTYGSHFNRVIVDAMRVGVVPIARNLGVSDNEDGVSVLFKPNVNYLMIPWDVKPKSFAEHIQRFMEINEDDYLRMVETNYKIVQDFDRKKIAQDYIDLALGNPCGVFNKLETGSMTDNKVKKTVDEIWCGHFGFNTKMMQTSTLDSFF